MSAILASMFSRFNTRSGSASTRGTKVRLNSLGIDYWQTDPKSFIIFVICKDRVEFESMRRTLNLYAGCRYPVVIHSADGTLTGSDVDIPAELVAKYLPTPK